MTLRVVTPTKVYYAVEADRPLTTGGIPDGALVVFTDSGLEESFDAVVGAWFSRNALKQLNDGTNANAVVVQDSLIGPEGFSGQGTIIPQVDDTNFATGTFDADAVTITNDTGSNTHIAINAAGVCANDGTDMQLLIGERVTLPIVRNVSKVSSMASLTSSPLGVMPVGVKSA